jgi:hypothetical protein
MTLLGMAILLNFSTATWAAPIETPEDKQSMLKIAEDIKKALKTNDPKVLLPYMMEKETLYFGPCEGDNNPADRTYSFNKFSKLFQEHTKNQKVKLNAVEFYLGLDLDQGTKFLTYESEGGTPKEYRYLYFLFENFMFEKRDNDWKLAGICHHPTRRPNFEPSHAFK